MIDQDQDQVDKILVPPLKSGNYSSLDIENNKVYWIGRGGPRINIDINYIAQKIFVLTSLSAILSIGLLLFGISRLIHCTDLSKKYSQEYISRPKKYGSLDIFYI